MSKNSARKRLSEKEKNKYRARRETCFAVFFEMTFTDEPIEVLIENAEKSKVIESIYNENNSTKNVDENEDFTISIKDDEFIMNILELFRQNKDEVDDTIRRFIKGWTIERLSRVTLSVLRFAVTELKYCPTSEKVVINEAVEISKKYSTPQDSRFVNGVLGSVVKELDNKNND